MKIKSKLYLSAGITAFLAIVVASVLFLSSSRIIEAIGQYDLARALQNEALKSDLIIYLITYMSKPPQSPGSWYNVTRSNIR